MAFSFEPLLVISAGLYVAISAGPEQEENPNDETEPVNAVADNKGILPANNVTDPSAILPDGELLPDSIMVIHEESGMS